MIKWFLISFQNIAFVIQMDLHLFIMMLCVTIQLMKK